MKDVDRCMEIYAGKQQRFQGNLTKKTIGLKEGERRLSGNERHKEIVVQ